MAHQPAERTRIALKRKSLHGCIVAVGFGDRRRHKCRPRFHGHILGCGQAGASGEQQSKSYPA